MFAVFVEHIAENLRIVDGFRQLERRSLGPKRAEVRREERVRARTGRLRERTRR